jgi:hypothetical protein
LLFVCLEFWILGGGTVGWLIFDWFWLLAGGWLMFELLIFCLFYPFWGIGFILEPGYLLFEPCIFVPWLLLMGLDCILDPWILVWLGFVGDT